MSDVIIHTKPEGAVWGVPDGVSMLAMKNWLAEGRRIVYVARDDARMFAMRDAMAMRDCPPPPVS